MDCNGLLCIYVVKNSNYIIPPIQYLNTKFIYLFTYKNILCIPDNGFIYFGCQKKSPVKLKNMFDPSKTKKKKTKNKKQNKIEKNFTIKFIQTPTK